MAFLIGDVKVVVNNVNLSAYADSVDTPQSKDQIDVSTFNPTGARSFLPGLTDATISVEFLQNYGSNLVHQTLYPLFTSGSQFPLYVVPDSDTATTATNPLFGGTAVLSSYNGLTGGLNDPAKFTAEFKPAPNAAFTWGTVAP